jgi:1-acyl-sn-glycerol-3-phosphate acyltransferase
MQPIHAGRNTAAGPPQKRIPPVLALRQSAWRRHCTAVGVLDLTERFRDRVDHRLVPLARHLVRGLEAIHPVRFEGIENLPAGPAVLVGNHGLLGYETAIFFAQIFDATGRLPRGCADRWFFRVPGLRDLLVRLGGMYGARENALRALREGHLVVCYPGGAREVFKYDDSQRYRLRWEQSLGFARVALEAGVPIIPFAAAGVDHTYQIVSRMRGTGRLLMGHDKYDLPLLRGLGPLPSPVPFWFRIGNPIDEEETIEALHRAAWTSAQRWLDDLVADWSRARRPPSASPSAHNELDLACAY